MLQCLLHYCCGSEEEEQHEPLREGISPPTTHLMTRSYQVAPTQDVEPECCHPNYNVEKNPHIIGIHDFLQRFRERWRRYDSIEPIPEPEAASQSLDAFRSTDKLSSKLPASPLRAALCFDSSRDIPTITKEEFVLPGSDLQKEMARVMSKYSYITDDECVICMEGFDPSNPRMPTRCGCGENKTYFHLPCLYQWIEQSQDCPSCRQKLTWQEFS